MFRVPANPDAPTFDDTFKVGFWRWLATSFSKNGAADRHEWMRRRNAATRTARDNQVTAAKAKLDTSRHR